MIEVKSLNYYRIVTSIPDDEWDRYITQHPRGNIFQSRMLYEVYERTKNYYPMKLFSINHTTGKLSGVLTSVVICEENRFFHKFTSHSVLQGGPLLSPGIENEAISQLIDEYDRRSQKMALYSEIRNLSDVRDELGNVENYTYEDHLNYLIDLNNSEEELWHKLHQSRRKNINRAQRWGVVIEEMNEERYLPIFYDLLRETYEEARIPLADKSLFIQAFRILYPKNHLKVFLARKGENYIAARAILLFKDTLYDWYAGARRDGLSAYPNDYLVWHILKWGRSRGYHIFDFGGAGKPGVAYGPREFKRRFGGELVNFGRYKAVYSPVRMKISDIGFRIYQKLAF
jgi:serine/alanine adding enzyme